MIIDVNTYIGHWPFRNLCNNSIIELSSLAEKNGITHMLVSSLNAIFYKDTMQGNLELHYELSNYHGKIKFIPFAVINPTYPAWKQDMKDAVLKYGFQGIELCPVYHNCIFSGPANSRLYINPAVDAFRLAGELGIPVRINTCFENFRQRHHMDISSNISVSELYTLLSSCEKTTAIINGSLPFSFGDEISDLLKARKNIFFDTTCLDTFIAQTMEKTLGYMDESHLCFGTLAPFQYIETNLTKVLFATKLNIQKVLFDNIRSYIKGV